MLGHSHALSGAVAGIGTGILLHLPTRQVAALAGFTAGLALLPDLDKCGSSPARCLGFVSEAIASTVRVRARDRGRNPWGAMRHASLSGGEHGNLVLLAAGISGDQREMLTPRLRDQHPVERVPVDHREAPGGDGMFESDRQFPESAVANSLRKVGGLSELSDGMLDGDFPYGGGTDVDVWLVVQPALDLF
jgi:hypothetical protein